MANHEASGSNPASAKQALAAIKRLQTRLDEQEARSHEPIAIVGLAVRLPGGAHSADSLWDMLLKGVDATSEVPADRWLADALTHADTRLPGKMLSRRGAFVSGVDRFDAGFFGIAPRDADNLDPQARMFFEVACEAIDDAGISLDSLRGSRTGVYVGMMNHDYQRLMWRTAAQVDAYSTTGYTSSMSMNRLSYLLGLQGPSMAVDTACSSSLVTLHLACQSLRMGESDAAIVGGVNLLLSPEPSIAFSKMGMLSADGRCKTFDAQADGYSRGEGCVAVVLKRLSDARANNDPLWAIIRGSAVNHNGRRSNGYTAPSARAHTEAMREALAFARLSPADISYVEAHGTGTSLGDPIEMDGLSQVYGVRAEETPVCWVGTIKTNIGHLESAAGLASVAKAALAMKYGTVPPNLHFQELNPHISLGDTRFKLPLSPQPWPEVPRRYSAISSYGAGGVNAHLVLEGVPETEAPRRQETAPPLPRILPLSARHPEALRQLAARYEALLAQTDEAGLEDLCYTASLRRTHHPERLALVGDSSAALRAGLASFLAGTPTPGVVSGRKAERSPRVAFVFSGHGSEWVGMAQQLLAQQPVFREAMEACDSALGRQAGPSVMALLSSPEGQAQIDACNANQPVIFAIQVALAALWASWGIRPDAVVGHSLGEVAAAHVAGVLSLDDAAALIVHRADVVGRARGRGGVALVALDRAQTEAALAGFEGRLWLSAINGPAATTVAGDSEAVDALIAAQTARGVFCRRVRMDFAAHSPHMDPLRQSLVDALRGLSPGAATVPLYSTVRAGKVEGRSLAADYWGDNLRQPVRFMETVEAMAADGITTYVELSPHPVLLPAVQAIFRARKEGCHTFASLRREEPEQAVMLASLAALHIAGVDVRWQAFYPRGGRCLRLPSYPWQGQRHWIPQVRQPGALTRPGHPLMGQPIYSSVEPSSRLWEVTVSTEELPYLADHRLRGAVVFPAAGYTEMALTAGRHLFGPGGSVVEALSFSEALILFDGNPRRLQLALTRTDDDNAVFLIASRPDSPDATEWAMHARGTLRRAPMARSAEPPTESLDLVRERCITPLSSSEHYAATDRRGLSYGPTFQGVTGLHRRDGEALATLALPDPLAGEQAPYGIHPALLDACFQVMLAAIPHSEELGAAEDTHVPVSLGSLTLEATAPGQLTVHVALAGETGKDLHSAELRAYDEHGNRVMRGSGLTLKRMPRDLGALVRKWLFEPTWEPMTLEAGTAASPGTGALLLLADRGGVASRLHTRLRQQGWRCILVHAGQDYARPSGAEAVVDPAQPGHFVRLLEEIGPCANVVHCWGLDAHVSGAEASVEQLRAALLPGVIAALHGLQAAVNSGAGVWLITRGAQPVAQPSQPVLPPMSDAGAVAQAPVLGLARVAAAEYPSLRCRCVDLGDGSDAELDALVRELGADVPESEVVLRGSERRVARLGRVGRYAHVPAVPRADGSYLITGGLGGLGLTVARWLVDRGARHLVLLGRRAPDGQTRQQISAMASTGARIVVASADTASFEELRALFSRFGGELPPLRGVIHAAGVLDDGLLADQRLERFERVFAPKVLGAWNLHRLSQGHTLDFFVLFSSVAGLLGNAGQANYAAANAFLDALAHHRRALGMPALSLNWGAWSEVGMAARLQAERGHQLASRGLDALSPAEGLAILEYTLGIQAPQLAAMRFDAALWSRGSAGRARASYLAPLLEGGAGTSKAASGVSRKEILTAAAAEREALVIRYLAENVARLLDMPGTRIDPERSVFTLGFDSLMALELRLQLESELAVRLSTVQMVDQPTCKDMAQLVLKQLAPASAPAPALDEATLQEIDNLSDEEMDSLLMRMSAGSRTGT